MPGSEIIETYDGTKVDVEPLKQLSGGGTRVDIDVVDGPRWRIDVNSTGNDVDIVTSWNSNGELADVDLPEWIDDVLMRLRRA